MPRSTLNMSKRCGTLNPGVTLEVLQEGGKAITRPCISNSALSQNNLMLLRAAGEPPHGSGAFRFCLCYSVLMIANLGRELCASLQRGWSFIV